MRFGAAATITRCYSNHHFNKVENLQFQWNVALTKHASQNPSSALSLYKHMQYLDIPPNNHTYPPLLKACAAVREAPSISQLQVHVFRLGLVSDLFVSAALIDAHGKCGRCEIALQLFEELNPHVADRVLWTTLISTLSHHGFNEQALQQFTRMRSCCGVDVVSFCALLSNPRQISSEPHFLRYGRTIHALSFKYGFELENRLTNTLIHMYSRGGALADASKAFDGFPIRKRDVVSWNSMISALAANGQEQQAVSTFFDMLALGEAPSKVTLMAVFNACAQLACIDTCQRVHKHLIPGHSALFLNDVAVATALLDMHARCGDLNLARRLFDDIQLKNVVSWSAMIAGYEQNMDFHKALDLFHKMVEEVRPNEVTMISVIAACSGLGASQPGRVIHSFVMMTGLARDGRVGSALIDMYAKCGDIQSARRVFDFTDYAMRTVVMWSAMIGAEGLHGAGQRSLSLFSDMTRHGFAPNEVTFVSLLSACSHGGLVQDGLSCFKIMQRVYRLSPAAKHYACVVDLLGRAGKLIEAHDFIRAMPIEADVAVWGSLLGACRLHGNYDLAMVAEKEILCLDPSSVGHQVLLANIYKEAGKGEDVIRTRVAMKKKGLKKIAGCSFVEMGNKVYGFIADDRSCFESAKVYEALQALDEQVKNVGLANKEAFDIKILINGQFHSERLAIAFAIMMMVKKKGETIRITKNLRVCKDCHDYTKLVSKVCKKELIVRDSHRFHHFKGGCCSCGDYW
ncbi:putative pentatricopeptide repeat-containing protein At3g11460, mitochondrial [Aristolochia californica]|uniref:putative pentatricopeptide repeat-containing protein At3g11460, mitochondrial n=1 Tax=Aristolochia californica TaxID=171875 RepID=UPI0035DDB48E